MREIPGPNPQQFAVLAKPTKVINTNVVNQTKRLEEQRSNILKDQNLTKNEQIKMTFFEESNKRSKINQLNRNVEEIMNQRAFLLNERRNKLRNLLYLEQKQYEDEYIASAITPLERAAKLREKAKQIKQNKENEDALFVQQKLEQKWRSECDELRSFQSKQLQAGMKDEHMRQIEEKIEREHRRLEEEAIFADLWHQDMLAKKEREDQEAKRTSDRNRDVAKVLKEQMMVLENQKIEEKRIRAENSKLLAEKLNIEKLEKQMNFQKKLEDQAQRRFELDQCVKARLINEAKRAREEATYDLQALEESLLSFQNEDEERARRKQELHEEQKRYREYLRQQYEEEKRKEKELESIIQEEIEKQFQKRLAQWKAEKQARKALFEKVLKERQLQIEEKIMRNKERERQIELERIEINKLMEFYRQQEKAEKEQAIQKAKEYGSNLLDQIEYNKYQKDLFKENEYHEYRRGMEAEAEYQKKLDETMYAIQSASFKHRYNE